MRVVARKIRKVTEIGRLQGITGIFLHISRKWREFSRARAYQRWIQSNAISDEDRSGFRDDIASFARQPLISIVLPVYNVDGVWLQRCIDSVLGQIYENWELCIADDHSTSK